jgi:polyvinyl alcohol dehydrogenase (cytochrome)
MRLLLAVTAAAATLFAQAPSGPSPSGEAIYRRACARCHDAGAGRAPLPEILKQTPAAAILRSLESGSMKFVGSQLRPADRQAVAEYLTGSSAIAVTRSPGTGRCADSKPFPNPLEGPRWIGWGVDQTNTRFQSATMAKLDASSVPKLKLKWAFGFPDAAVAFSQPTVAGGRLYIGSATGTFYSIDAATGCIHWTFEANTRNRVAPQIGKWNGHGKARYAVWLADWSSTAYALDAATGELLWKTQVETHAASGITGSPALHDGRLYVPVSSSEEFVAMQPTYDCCTFRGSVVALDAFTGKVIWKTYTIAEAPKPTRKKESGGQLYGPSGAGVWSAPTIDAKLKRLYIATGDNYSDPPTDTSDAVLALDLASGKIVWQRQFTKGDAFIMGCGQGRKHANCPEADGPDFDFGASPILTTLPGGKRVLLAGQKSGLLYAIDPDKSGAELWQARAGKGGTLGGIQWGPAIDGQNVYAAVSDIAFGMGGMDPKAGGGITAYQIATGEKLWHSRIDACGGRRGCSPAQSAAVTAIPGVVFSGALDGHLRAYSAKDGTVLWDEDTTRDYETVNGVKAKGGAINAPGPVIVNGILYVNSGYGMFGSTPGNVLLAYSVDGK